MAVSLFLTLFGLASCTALSSPVADAACGSTCGADSRGSSLIQKKATLGTWVPSCVALDNNQGITDTVCEPCGNGQTWWPCNTHYCDCSGTSPEAPASSPDGGGEGGADGGGGDGSGGDGGGGGGGGGVAGGCVALDNNQGVSDSSCAPCGKGQTWWPCNTPYCSCSGVSPSPPPPSSSPLPPPPPPAISPPSPPTPPVEVVPAPATVPPPSPPAEVPAPSTSGGSSSTPIGSWFSEDDFEKFFPHVDNAACTGKGFFNRGALLKAAESFPDFANTGDVIKDKLEFAAFLAHTSHETTGGWATAPGGPQSWGYCFKEERGCETGHCTGYTAPGNPCSPQNFDCTAAPGQTYQGRGPVQLSWNYNYGKFSKDLFGDASVLLNDPSKVATDPVLAYQSALWFWMTPQTPKPSCHDVMTGIWKPSSQDASMGRVAGLGMVTNIINGGLECNKPTNGKVKDRVEFFRRYLEILNVPMPSDATLYCNKMTYYR